MGAGAYTKEPFVRTYKATHQTIDSAKDVGWALTRRWVLTMDDAVKGKRSPTGGDVRGAEPATAAQAEATAAREAGERRGVQHGRGQHLGEEPGGQVSAGI